MGFQAAFFWLWKALSSMIRSVIIFKSYLSEPESVSIYSEMTVPVEVPADVFRIDKISEVLQHIKESVVA